MNNKLIFSITLLMSIVCATAMETPQKRNGDLPPEIAETLDRHNKAIQEIIEDRKNDANAEITKSVGALLRDKESESSSEATTVNPFDASKDHLNYVLNLHRTQDKQEQARQDKIAKLTQVEWLAKTCKEFHKNKLETVETKNYTSDNIATLEEILKNLKQISK